MNYFKFERNFTGGDTPEHSYSRIHIHTFLFLFNCQYVPKICMLVLGDTSRESVSSPIALPSAFLAQMSAATEDWTVFIIPPYTADTASPLTDTYCEVKHQ